MCAASEPSQLCTGADAQRVRNSIPLAWSVGPPPAQASALGYCQRFATAAVSTRRWTCLIDTTTRVPDFTTGSRRHQARALQTLPHRPLRRRAQSYDLSANVSNLQPLSRRWHRPLKMNPEVPSTDLGMAMARNQDRTVLVELGDLRPFSDIDGIHAIRLNNTTERRQELAQRLQIAGCPVSLQGTDWHKAGDFEAAVAFLEEGASEPVAFEERQPTIPDYKRLSEDAKSLLVEAANSATGYILRILLLRGWSIKANGKEFVEIGNRRSEVKWDQALKDLFDLGLVKDSEGDVEGFEFTYDGEGFEVTHKGYQVADVLEAGK